MSFTSDARPGHDPSCPHQDLRIPSRIPSHYLNQAVSTSSVHLPSSSSSLRQTLTTPPVAVQIASLHRAAEVARFEWRAAQRRLLEQQERQVTRRNDVSARPYQPLQESGERIGRRSSHRTGRTLGRDEERRDRSRIYSSSLEAYLSAARELSRSMTADVLEFGDDFDDLDEFMSDDSSTSSDYTDVDAVTTTLRSSQEQRREYIGRQTARSEARGSRQTTPINPTTSAFTSSASSARPDQDVLAEGQVWDRMVEDLAIGAGVGGQLRTLQGSQSSTPYSRGISGGIAASMLALSAAIPRPESSSGQRNPNVASSRLLPHPIWARRYPGAAGEWLRGELARRANVSATPASAENVSGLTDNPTGRAAARTRTGSSEPTASSINAFDDIFSNPRARDRVELRNQTSAPSSSPWSVLRFPSLDPTSRNGAGLNAWPAAAVRSDNRGNSLTVPSYATALSPVSPSNSQNSEQARSRSTRSTVGRVEEGTRDEDSFSATTESAAPSASRRDAASLVANMARATRAQNALLASLARTSTARGLASVGPGRAVQGGMDYIRRLRVLDGIESPQAEDSSSREARRSFEEPSSPARPHEVFPWYQPVPSPSLVDRMARLHLHGSPTNAHDFDPDGTSVDWYQMARARMAAQSTLAARAEPIDDPNGERIEDEMDAPLRVRRRVLTSEGTSASQRQRNRAALVIADDAPRQRSIESRNVAEGWTVIDQRPSSPIRRTRDEGSENVTTWFRGPALSTSPGLIDHTDDTQMQQTVNPVSPRATRRPRRLASLTAEDLHSVGVPGESTAPRRSMPEPGARLSASPRDSSNRSSTAQSHLMRRAEYASGLHEEPGTVPENPSGIRFVYREDTPSPEPQQRQPSEHQVTEPSQVDPPSRRLSTIGARLEEEFRARQNELRLREERLRSEVARRRLELDQLRRQQGRIGRVVEWNRRERPRARPQPSDENVRPPSLQTATAAHHNNTRDESARLPGQALGSSSLVRRRTVRDPAPGLRPYRRPDTRRRIELPTVNGLINRQMTLNTLAATTLSQSQNVSLRRTRSFTGTRTATEHLVAEQDALDDHTVVRGRTYDAIMAITSSLTPGDLDVIGSAGAALVSFVDALATPWSIVRAARFSSLPYTVPTVVQPPLSSTLDDTTYPLRFELYDAERPEKSKGRGETDGAKLQNILQNDESTFTMQLAETKGASLHICLKFLAAIGGGQNRSPEVHALCVQQDVEDKGKQTDRLVNNPQRCHDAVPLNREELRLVKRCLEASGRREQAALREPNELYRLAGASGQELLAKRTDSLSRSALFSPTGMLSSPPVDVGPSFCLTSLVIKIPHRQTMFANGSDAGSSTTSSLFARPYWLALIFVSWTPISVSDMDAYNGWSDADIRRMAERHNVRGPGFEKPTDLYASSMARPSFDDDKSLGDPYAMDRNEKGKSKIVNDTRSLETPKLVPVGLSRLHFSQTTLNFDLQEADEQAGSSSLLRGGVRGVSGRFLAIKLMRMNNARQGVVDHGEAPPALEIQWIGAHGWAGPRSFGAAAWRD